MKGISEVHDRDPAAFVLRGEPHGRLIGAVPGHRDFCITFFRAVKFRIIILPIYLRVLLGIDH